ncbi:tRNA dihydrouridine synthase [Sporobolomyces salmoneus]|uniref:tRNA dihydrouridine synthase n=1 Tax=Sporobolomyces salmoneus TaxID=183962 RepID=UPI00317672B1
MSSTPAASFGAHSHELSKEGEGDVKLITTDEMEVPPKTEIDKLGGYDLWKDMGEPKYVVAPMVDQSELAWRILSRLYGANLCYTPMFHAALFSSQPKYQHEMFDLSPGSIEGVAPYDRPLIVQFCANDKDQWLESAQKVVGKCDAVDLNLGCPQGIARRGKYGAFLMEEWDLIRSMISHLHQNLSIPVTAKIRCFPTLSKTLSYASHVFASGAQILTLHGRTREMKGQLTGLASWEKIKQVVQLVQPKIPVLANGGVPGSKEVESCLEETGANGLMSAEGNLYNPMLFNPSNSQQGRQYLSNLSPEMRQAIEECDSQLEGEWDMSQAAYAPAPYLAAQYLAIVLTIPNGTQTATSAIKAHLYKMFRPIWAEGRHTDMREKLGKAGQKGLEYKEKVGEYVKWVEEFTSLLKSDLETSLLPSGSYRPLTQQEVDSLYSGVVPYSHCQPYLRATKPENEKEETELKKVDLEAKRKRAEQEEPVLDSKRSKTTLDSEATVNGSANISNPLCSNHTTLSSPALPKLPTASTDLPKPCSNSGSTKCSNLACKACCAALRSLAGDEESKFKCEFHEDKEMKAKIRSDEMKASKQKKKEQGKIKARENQLRDRELAEKKRKEREEKRKLEQEAKGEAEGSTREEEVA